VTAIGYIVPDFPLALAQIGLVVHKGPIVLEKCYCVLEDVRALDVTIGLFSSNLLNLDLMAHIMENLTFNLGDILYNFNQASEHLKKDEFNAFGETAGRIAVDVLYVNPHDGEFVWNVDKSSVIVKDGDDKGARKVKGTFYDNEF
jgi:hypothetical protein